MSADTPVTSCGTGIGSVDVNANAEDPGLFELPDAEPPVRPSRPPLGRNRETWTLTANAKVEIIDAHAARAAFKRQVDEVITIATAAAAEDLEDDLPTEPLDMLAWLIWPTEGMDGPIEAGAFRVLEVESEVEPAADSIGTATWSITVKLTHVEALRRLAIEAHPDENAAITESFAVAWQRAVDPYAPLRSIPGVAWSPGEVEVRHVPAR